MIYSSNIFISRCLISGISFMSMPSIIFKKWRETFDAPPPPPSPGNAKKSPVWIGLKKVIACWRSKIIISCSFLVFPMHRLQLITYFYINYFGCKRWVSTRPRFSYTGRLWAVEHCGLTCLHIRTSLMEHWRKAPIWLPLRHRNVVSFPKVDCTKTK